MQWSRLNTKDRRKRHGGKSIRASTDRACSGAELLAQFNKGRQVHAALADVGRPKNIAQIDLFAKAQQTTPNRHWTTIEPGLPYLCLIILEMLDGQTTRLMRAYRAAPQCDQGGGDHASSPAKVPN
jgi:hypothetical protein